jgi:hypothetical protein
MLRKTVGCWAQARLAVSSLAWVETRIVGLTTQPLALHGYYSQTYHPFHHNFDEEFIFEPRLDSGTSAEQLHELAAANVQLFYVLHAATSDQVYTLGFDGEFRPL